MSTQSASSSRRGKRGESPKRDFRDSSKSFNARGNSRGSSRKGDVNPNGGIQKEREKETKLGTNNKGGSIEGNNAKESLLHERTLWVLLNLVGKRVEAQVKNGDYYEGILHTVSTDNAMGVVLRMARKKQSKGVTTERPYDTFVIYPSDLVQIYAKDVTVETRKGFLSDTEISGANASRTKTLQPWQPDVTDAPALAAVDLTLENNNDTGWDQFEVNKKLFGVETTWDERYYTTELNRSDPRYLQHESEAVRIVREIEGKTSTNPHVREERGLQPEGDEESRYSSVLRGEAARDSTRSFPKTDAAGKYVPPARRGQLQSSQASQTPQSSSPPSIPATALGPSASTGHIPNTFRSPASITSPTSPRSPLLSPLSPGKGDTHPIVSERLRIRMHLVNERLKNSAPVPANQDEFATPNRSPLLSPLVGDARRVNAMNLEISTPTLDESIVDDFYKFSLSSKQENKDSSVRRRRIDDFKNFSSALDKKVPPKSEAPPQVPAKEESQVNKEPAPLASVPPASASPTPSASTPSIPNVSSPPPSTSATPKTKLNPNAKEFKPMSADAPSFSPVPSQEPALLPEERYYPQPYPFHMYPPMQFPPQQGQYYYPPNMYVPPHQVGPKRFGSDKATPGGPAPFPPGQMMYFPGGYRTGTYPVPPPQGGETHPKQENKFQGLKQNMIDSISGVPNTDKIHRAE